MTKYLLQIQRNTKVKFNDRLQNLSTKSKEKLLDVSEEPLMQHSIQKKYTFKRETNQKTKSKSPSKGIYVAKQALPIESYAETIRPDSRNQAESATMHFQPLSTQDSQPGLMPYVSIDGEISFYDRALSVMRSAARQSESAGEFQLLAASQSTLQGYPQASFTLGNSKDPLSGGIISIDEGQGV